MNSSQAVYEGAGEFFSPSDLSTFQTHWGIPQSPVAYSTPGAASDQTCANNSSECQEGNLDIQYIMGVAQGVPTSYLIDSGYDGMVTWLTNAGSQEKPPTVISISWVFEEKFVPPSVLAAWDIEAMKVLCIILP